MKSNRSTFYFATPAEAESAFYSAFEMKDIDLMEALLARDETCCIHPGGVLALGRDDILRSWKRVFSLMEPFAIQHEVLSKTVTEELAIHTVGEVITLTEQTSRPTSIVLATNVYVRQENGWRMRNHHASLPADKKKLEMLTQHEAPSTLQ